MKLLGKIICLFAGHKEWPTGPAAVAISHPILNGTTVNIEFCTRCDTLWGKPVKNILTVGNKQYDIIELENLLKKNFPKKFDFNEDTTPIAPIAREFDYRFIDPLTNESLSLPVRLKRELASLEVEIESQSGNVSLWTIENKEPNGPERVEDIQDWVNTQIVNLLGKVDKPAVVYVPIWIFDLLDYGILSKANAGIIQSIPGFSFGSISPGVQANVPSGNSQGTLQSKSESSGIVASGGSSNEF